MQSAERFLLQRILEIQVGHLESLPASLVNTASAKSLSNKRAEVAEARRLVGAPSIPELQLPNGL